MKNIFVLIFIVLSFGVMGQSFLVSGVVLNKKNKPIRGAVVSLVGIHQTQKTNTDRFGKFSLVTGKLYLEDWLIVLDVYNKKSIQLHLNENMDQLMVDSGFIKIKALTIHKIKPTPDVDVPNNGPVLVKKPVIYLYPEKQQTVSVQVNFKGTFRTTYPNYKNGWNVEANPNGQLINKADGRTYDYLFWEGKLVYDKSALFFTDGFIVESNNALSFLQNILTKFGLNNKEQNDFIVYWLPEIQQHPVCFIHFRFNEAYDYFSSNVVSPTPNTSLRIMMELKPIPYVIKVKPQTIPTVERKGFVLVEWGGVQLIDEIQVGDVRF